MRALPAAVSALGGLVDDDVDAGPSGHLGDACAHLSRTDHAHPLDSIMLTFLLPSTCGKPRPGFWAGLALIKPSAS